MTQDKLCMQIEALYQSNKISQKFYRIIKGFFSDFSLLLRQHHCDVLNQGFDFLHTLENLLVSQIENPFVFSPFHQMEEAPFDFYSFGMKFIEYLVDRKTSQVLGIEHLQEVESSLLRGENIVFFANHQTEPDPQILDYLLQKSGFSFGKQMVFVAGERVLVDPVAAPFSRGRNLLCIYSKKYIDTPLDMKEVKTQHNRKTMQLMKDLFNQGGVCIYVAPSGGRDRKNAHGIIEVAPFDPQSIELFLLLGRSAKKTTRFFPLALDTYDLLPPPETTQKDLGEARILSFAPAGLAVGREFLFEEDAKTGNKQDLRLKRAEFAWSGVNLLYRELVAR